MMFATTRGIIRVDSHKPLCVFAAWRENKAGTDPVLLPFDGARRFGTDVITDTIDAAHFINDPIRDRSQ